MHSKVLMRLNLGWVVVMVPVMGLVSMLLKHIGGEVGMRVSVTVDRMSVRRDSGRAAEEL